MAKGGKNREVTWAQAARDVVTKLITTGQLPVGIFGACIILLVYKTPDKDIPDVWATIALFVRAHAGLGYLLNVPILGIWYLHARFQRRNAEEELKRIAPERTKDQQESFSGKLGSSRR